MERCNWIAGRPVPSLGAGRFERRAARAGCGLLSTWPRSDERDLQAALERLRAGAESWSAIDPCARDTLLERARVWLAEERSLADEAELGLGLDSGELAQAQACAGRDGSPAPRLSPAPSRGIALCSLHWTQLCDSSAAFVFEELARGRAVLVTADARLPEAGERLARALTAAEVPDGAWAILHGMRESALIEAAAQAGIETWAVCGTAARLARWRRGAARGAAREERTQLVQSGAVALDARADLARQARADVERAFGRARALGGQADGALARVTCPDALFAAFTTHLEVALAESAARAPPLPLVDREAAEEVARLWAIGIDEGATLIHGGTLLERDAGLPARRGIAPTVFTNVEPWMHLARRADPAPVLALVRSYG
jgi:acyl-CoA reductase-like NAD-dependent aldehyde dehydrogenase